MRTLLIDADIPCYKVAAACETYIDDGNDWVQASMDKREGIQALDAFIADMKSELKADAVVLALTDKDNFRKEILPTYKANRSDTRRPIGLQTLRKHAAETYDTYIRPGLEGDDILGILATGDIIKGEKIIVSIDKDFKTIPGKFFNFGHPELGVVELSENEANYNHMLQTLTGDRTDGYTGCPGIGPVNAHKILDGADGDWWAAVVKAYAKAKLSEQEALVQARVARILRASDYDFANKKPILWVPPAKMVGCI